MPAVKSSWNFTFTLPFNPSSSLVQAKVPSPPEFRHLQSICAAEIFQLLRSVSVVHPLLILSLNFFFVLSFTGSGLLCSRCHQLFSYLQFPRLSPILFHFFLKMVRPTWKRPGLGPKVFANYESIMFAFVLQSFKKDFCWALNGAVSLRR